MWGNICLGTKDPGQQPLTTPPGTTLQVWCSLRDGSQPRARACLASQCKTGRIRKAEPSWGGDNKARAKHHGSHWVSNSHRIKIADMWRDICPDTKVLRPTGPCWPKNRTKLAVWACSYISNWANLGLPREFPATATVTLARQPDPVSAATRDHDASAAASPPPGRGVYKDFPFQN